MTWKPDPKPEPRSKKAKKAIDRILKDKPCAECKRMFTPKNGGVRVCGLECAIDLGKRETAEKEQKKANKRAKNKTKDHPEVYYKENKKQLQELVQLIARLIDKDVHCIDCERSEAHRWDGGHYKSKGAHKSISLNLHNIFMQNGWCNNQGSSSEEQFLKGIKKMYGNEYGEFVDWLALKYSYIGLKAHEYPEIITEALKIARELKKTDSVYTPKQRIELREECNNRLNIYI